MTERTGSADHSVPGYELDETLFLTEPAQYKALFEPTRAEIVSLLIDRAATTAELATILGKPKGTVGHHLKTLEAAGLVRVVRTERVRALEAKYYGRTARVFLFENVHEGAGSDTRTFSTVADEIAAVPLDQHHPYLAGVRYARIPTARAEEWRQRVSDLLDEFMVTERGDDITYGFAVALFPTDRVRLATDVDGTPAGDDA